LWGQCQLEPGGEGDVLGRGDEAGIEVKADLADLLAPRDQK
jgi:hypothetical protein